MSAIDIVITLQAAVVLALAVTFVRSLWSARKSRSAQQQADEERGASTTVWLNAEYLAEVPVKVPRDFAFRDTELSTFALGSFEMATKTRTRADVNAAFQAYRSTGKR